MILKYLFSTKNKIRKKSKIFGFLSILTSLFVLSGCSSSQKEINSLEDLIKGDYIIGTPALTYCEEQAPSIFENASKFVSFGDISAAYLALQQGKIDAFIQDDTMARVEISKGVDGVKVLDGTVGTGNSIAIGISDKSKIVTKNQIDSILEKFTAEGLFDDLKEKWVNRVDYTTPEIELPTGDVPTLKVATSGNVEPFSFYKNGELTGLDIELSKRIAKELNYKIEYETNSNYPSLITSTQSGLTDLLMANLYVTEERKEQMPLSNSYYETTAVAVVRDGSSFQSYNSLEELKNKKIGYETSSTQFGAQLEKYLPNAKPVLFNSTSDCVVALQNNRIDGFITDLPNAKFLEQTVPGLKTMPEYLDDDNYGFAFAKNSPLTEEFNQVIQKFKDINLLSDLEDKWFSNLDDINKEIPIQDDSKSYKRTVKAITTALIKPMCYYSGNNTIIGFEAELLLLICEELNYKLEFLNPVGASGSVISELEIGKADLAVNTLSITEERLEKFDFTIPYYNGAAVIVVKSGNTAKKGFFEKLKNSFEKTFVVEQRWKMIFEGMLVTLLISFCSGIIGILLGFGLCMIKRKTNKPVRKIVNTITRIIQGTPIVVFLMIMYYVVFGKIDISAIIVAILSFGINFGAYSAEIMRSGFEAVHKGQEEAARAMGYSNTQTFWKISFPQAAKKFLPVLRGEFISMVKMTSIAGYISVSELTRIGDIIRSKTMEAFFPLIVIAFIYFGIAELLTFSLTLLEKKLDVQSRPFKVKGVKKS